MTTQREGSVHAAGWRQNTPDYLKGFSDGITRGNTVPHVGALPGAGDSATTGPIALDAFVSELLPHLSRKGKVALDRYVAAGWAETPSRRKIQRRIMLALDQGGNPYGHKGPIPISAESKAALDDDPLIAFLKARLSPQDFAEWEELMAADDPPPFKGRPETGGKMTTMDADLRAREMHRRGQLSTNDLAHALLSPPSGPPVGSAARFHREFNTQRLAVDGGLDEDVLGQAERRIRTV